MAGSLGLGINLGASTSGGGAGTSSTAIDGSNFWQLASAGNLQPYPTGAVTDYNLCWDLDGTDYTPQASPTTDGYLEVNGDGDLTPDDV